MCAWQSKRRCITRKSMPPFPSKANDFTPIFYAERRGSCSSCADSKNNAKVIHEFTRMEIAAEESRAFKSPTHCVRVKVMSWLLFICRHYATRWAFVSPLEPSERLRQRRLRRRRKFPCTRRDFRDIFSLPSVTLIRAVDSRC